MSFFSETLRDLLAQAGLKQAHLADVSGVDKTLISRFLSGAKEPSREQVVALAIGLSADPVVRAQLLVAYLRDQAEPMLKRGGIDERHFGFSTRSPASEALGEPQWWETIPAGLAVKLEIIGRQALAQPAFMALLDQWVTFLESQKGR